MWKSLPYNWYDKPAESVNYMSIRDFEDFGRDYLKARLVERVAIASRSGKQVKILPNLRADEVIFVIAKE